MIDLFEYKLSGSISNVSGPNFLLNYIKLLILKSKIKFKPIYNLFLDLVIFDLIKSKLSSYIKIKINLIYNIYKIKFIKYILTL